MNVNISAMNRQEINCANRYCDLDYLSQNGVIDLQSNDLEQKSKIENKTDTLINMHMHSQNESNVQVQDNSELTMNCERIDELNHELNHELKSNIKKQHAIEELLAFQMNLKRISLLW